MKGYLWFPGGGIFFGESLEDAAKRILESETGLKGGIKGLIGIYSMLYLKGIREYAVNVTYLVEQSGGRLAMEKQHSEFSFVKKIETDLHPYVKKVLQDSNVFRKRPSIMPADRSYTYFEEEPD